MGRKGKIVTKLGFSALKLGSFLIVLAAMLAALVIVITSDTTFSTASYQDRRMSDYNTGWQIANMEKRTYITLPQTFNSKEASITRAIIPELNNNMVLVFPNNRQVVEITADNADNAVIYSSNGHDFPLPCITDHYCMVELPTSRTIYHITIKFANYEGDTCVAPEIKMGSLFAAYTYIAYRDLSSIINIIILFIISVILIFFTISTSARHMFDARISSLAIFTICSTILITCSSSISELTPLRPEVSASITYISILVLPIPILHYIWYVTGQRHSAIIVIVILCRINIVAQLVAGILTDISASVMIIPACLVFLAALVTCVIYMHKEYKSDPSKYNKAILGSLLAMLAVSAIITAIYEFIGNPMHTLMQFSLAAFCVVQFVTVVVSIRRQSEKARETEQELTVYSKLSKKDFLTGIDNRYSFDHAIDSIMKDLSDNSDVALIILDLNGLKYTNDSHGHLAGDDLIKRAASCISDAYNDIGTAYRIGGDEFAVLIPNCACDDDELVSRLNNAIAENNKSHSLALSIAYGISHILGEDGKRVNISKWKDIADMNMYRNKQEQKSGSTYLETPEILDVMNCIVTTIEEKDTYTAKHSARTRLISEFLATKLGLSPKTISDTRIAANLHDIGKIAIPDAILNKPGSLTEEEFAIMKTHAALGAKIVDNSNSMKDIAAAIRHHHERYDGKGYPDGLSHKDIPTISRIISIADSIDAMTSDRVYRESFSFAYCRLEIENNLGIMYDPVIGRIALDNWDTIEKIIRENK